MKVRLSHAVFKEAVLRAFSTVDPADPRVLLTAILFDVTGDKLRLLGSDLSLGTLVEIDVVAEPGRVLVPSKKLVQVARTIPEGDVLLIVQQNELHIFARYEEDAEGRSSSKAHWSLHVHDPRLYPDFPKFEPEKSVAVERLPFCNALARVLVGVPRPAKPADRDKYIHLQGVYLDGACMYSSDYHLSMREVVTTGATGLFVPLDAATTLLDLLKKASEPTFRLFVRGDTYVLFRIGHETYHAALQDTKFPDVEARSFAPTSGYGRLMLVDKKELLAAIDRAKVTADEKSTFMLTVTYQGGRIRLATRDSIDDQFVELIDNVELREGPEERFDRHIKLDSFRSLVAVCRSERVALRTGTGSTVEEARFRIEDNGLVAILLPIKVDRPPAGQPSAPPPPPQVIAEEGRPEDIPF